MQTSDILCQMMAANRHELPPKPEGAPPIEPVLHCIWTEDELRETDPLLRQFAYADRKLQSMYSDTVHANDESHLHVEIDRNEDMKMQRLHHQVASVKQSLYSLPSSRWAN